MPLIQAAERLFDGRGGWSRTRCTLRDHGERPMLPKSSSRTSLDLLEALALAQDVASLKRAMVDFGRNLGFDVSAIVGVTEGVQLRAKEAPSTDNPVWVGEAPSGSHERAVLRILDNLPAGARASIEPFFAEGTGRKDPVMQYIKVRHIPLLWDRVTYERGGAADVWEAQAAYGAKNGIAVALHLPGRKHVCYGLDRSSPIESAEVQALFANVQLFAAYAAEAEVVFLTDSDGQGRGSASLTVRERECLKWTSEGKTAFEIAAILNLSESRVSKLLVSVNQKLCCVNKQQAVGKAVRLGLI